MNTSPRTVLVTGGAGFIGSHLVDALVALGKEVVVYDWLSTGSEGNLPSQVKVTRGDVRDRAQVAESMKGADLVFHLAANANGTRSIDDPRFDFETNAMGTFNVAEAALEAGVKKLVYMSSASVYGTPQHFPMGEDHPTKPFVYVANNGSDEIVEVDLEKWEIVRRFKTEGAPYNLDVTSDGRYLVTSQKKSGSTGIFDLSTGEEIARIKNSRKVTHGVVIAPDNRYAFVSVEGIGG